LRAAQPAVAFIGQRLGDVEAFPRTLIDIVFAVDEPTRGEADELLVEQLDRIIGVKRGTT
jgi:hypothetical protein